MPPSATVDEAPTPSVAAALALKPFKPLTTRRDTTIPLRTFAAAWAALHKTQVLHVSCVRLGERAAIALLAAYRRLEEVDEREQAELGEGAVVVEREYTFQASARRTSDGRAGEVDASETGAEETVFKIKSTMLDIQSFATDFLARSTHSRQDLLVDSLDQVTSALKRLTDSILLCTSLYGSVPFSKPERLEQDAVDGATDEAALPRLFQLSITLRGPVWDRFLRSATQDLSTLKPQERRRAFVEFCFAKNDKLRPAAAAASSPRVAISPISTGLVRAASGSSTSTYTDSPEQSSVPYSSPVAAPPLCDTLVAATATAPSHDVSPATYEATTPASEHLLEAHTIRVEAITPQDALPEPSSVVANPATSVLVVAEEILPEKDEPARPNPLTPISTTPPIPVAPDTAVLSDTDDISMTSAVVTATEGDVLVKKAKVEVASSRSRSRSKSPVSATHAAAVSILDFAATTEHSDAPEPAALQPFRVLLLDLPSTSTSDSTSALFAHLCSHYTSTAPLPFDLILGVGPASLPAVLLGRLGLAPNQAAAAYERIQTMVELLLRTRASEPVPSSRGGDGSAGKPKSRWARLFRRRSTGELRAPQEAPVPVPDREAALERALTTVLPSTKTPFCHSAEKQARPHTALRLEEQQHPGGWLREDEVGKVGSNGMTIAQATSRACSSTFTSRGSDEQLENAIASAKSATSESRPGEILNLTFGTARPPSSKLQYTNVTLQTIALDDVCPKPVDKRADSTLRRTASLAVFRSTSHADSRAPTLLPPLSPSSSSSPQRVRKTRSRWSLFTLRSRGGS
ncbi:hypothetical protein JCM10908_000746 [Rhodotorula pacifica]|uniref:uncharacterized protein n=1 Tax=Rhodotorula pacifica TaxID=1495444 RepID=UPI003172C7BC